MAEIHRLSGIRIRLPDEMQLADRDREAEGSRGWDFTHPIPLDVPPDPMWGELRATLGSAGLDLVDTLDIVPGGDLPAVRAAAPTVAFDVPVGDDEDAVVLLDEEGVLTWMLPTADRVTGATDDPDRGGGSGRARRFELRIEPTRDTADGRGAIDWVTGWVGRRIKAMVLRFTTKHLAGLAVDAVVARLESGNRMGPVLVGDRDPLRWRPLDDLSGLDLPADSKVLLLVHGTFSSTLGSFGHLGAGPGVPTLAHWLDDYDLIVGYDHPTLSATPVQNAEAILAMLRTGPWQAARVDVVCFSRGGLVARWLVERLLPGSGLQVEVRNVVCVAATNAGTLLASPAQWKHLLDLTTNLAASACRLTTLLAPQAAVATAVLGQVVNGASVLVKALTTTTLQGGHVPGLQAMDPDGGLVAALNSGDAPDVAAGTRYLAVVSDFEPKLFQPADREKTGLPPRLAQWAADLFVDSLFGKAPNDLVVHNASTRTLHPALQDRMQQALDVGESREVYHLNFFLSERTAPMIGDLAAPRSANGGDRGPGAADPFDEALVGGGGGLVDLFVEARGPSAAEVGKKIVIDIDLQREPFASHVLPGSDRAQAAADPGTPLFVDVVPRRGLAVVGEMVKEVPMPAPDQPRNVFFMLQGVEALDEPAEVFVNVRQGNDTLMQLELGIQVVEAGATVVSQPMSVAGAPPADRGTPAPLKLVVSQYQGPAQPMLAFILDVAPLGINPEYPAVDLPADFRQQLEDRYTEIEAAWKTLKASPDGFEARLRGIGQGIGEMLLPKALRDDLWIHREALKGLAVFTDEPFIPWELVYVPSPDGMDGYFLAELGFTRSMRGAFCPDVLRVRENGRFTVVPRYPEQLHLDYAIEEETWLYQQLHTRPVDIMAPDRARHLRARLAEGGPVDLLHFAGHGEADDHEVYLVMGGETGSDLFAGRLFATSEANPIRLQGEDGGRPLVFVNACKTGRRVAVLAGERSWARTFLKLGRAGAFVAPLWSVGDQRACDFSKAFYTALMRGDTFATATRIARDAARKAGDPSWLSYTVYASPHATVAFE